MGPVVVIQNIQPDNDPMSDPISHHREQCLSNPEILRMILKSFCNKELAILAQVNKLWNFEARCVLKCRGTFVASLTERTTCEGLQEFARSLELMRVIPFCGMQIKFGGPHLCSRPHISTHQFNAACDSIVDRINCKVLAVKFQDDWDQYEDCPGFAFLKNTLRNCQSVLQEFSIFVGKNRRLLFQIIREDYIFSNLSTLRFGDVGPYTASDEYTCLIKNMVLRTPNLQVLCTAGFVNLRENLLRGSSAVHVTNYPYYVDDIPENAAGSLQMKRLRFVDFSDDFCLDRFHRIFFDLLEASRRTLTWMHIDVILLSALQAYGIRLENVRTLIINMELRDRTLIRCIVSLIAAQFDFYETFPNLDTVDVRPSICPPSLQIKFIDNVDQLCYPRSYSTSDNRAVNIKNVNAHWNEDADASATNMLLKMFPDTQKLLIRAGCISFEEIWRSGRRLEELDVTLTGLKALGYMNLDSIFCGIDHKVVAKLREEDEVYLRAHILQRRTPSITNLTGLRTFKLFLESDFVDDPDFLKIPNYCFSKVTALVAFERFRNLTVTLATDDENIEKALSHLKDYIAVRLDSLT